MSGNRYALVPFFASDIEYFERLLSEDTSYVARRMERRLQQAKGKIERWESKRERERQDREQQSDNVA